MEYSGSFAYVLLTIAIISALNLCSGNAEVESFQFIGVLSSLQYLDIGGVSLSNASDWLQVLNTLPSLVELYLPFRDIANIPADHVPAVINSTSLSILDLSFNSLGPSMPAWIFSLNNLDSFYLAGVVSLKGTSIPFGLINMTSHLKNLDLSGNYFRELPMSLSKCTTLDNLNISENKFVGTIPKWIGTSFSTLKILNLRTIPRCFYNLTAMTTFQAPDHNSVDYFYYSDLVLREDAEVVIKGRQVSYSSTLNLDEFQQAHSFNPSMSPVSLAINFVDHHFIKIAL
ncbi:hypothetical protein FEM48_Zijuj08G0177200 [Ziziphus jujuba var. spinosa]|uniref:Uncharacterized protein n=1 Tax=Ziziphus jujuba var. spinosa TaxID=714518 RepID=A0A978V0H2_ZIZJJ|nr:hypothetical protein FEM48_Zijuj08G0177200 [Ziziphus jujuba var. spinosa]